LFLIGFVIIYTIISNCRPWVNFLSFLSTPHFSLNYRQSKLFIQRRYSHRADWWILTPGAALSAGAAVRSFFALASVSSSMRQPSGVGVPIVDELLPFGKAQNLHLPGPVPGEAGKRPDAGLVVFVRPDRGVCQAQDSAFQYAFKAGPVGIVL
jgi:hypothetical protein